MNGLFEFEFGDWKSIKLVTSKGEFSWKIAQNGYFWGFYRFFWEIFKDFFVGTFDSFIIFGLILKPKGQ